MLDFKNPAVKDSAWASPILKNSGYFGADCAFGTLYIWSDAYDTKICKYKDFLLKCHGKREIFYGFPVGRGDLKGAFEAMMEDADERGIPFRLSGLTKEMASIVTELFPERFDFTEVRDFSDYIYQVEDMASLRGKKFHSKRNHISKFERMYPWAYKKIGRENIADCQKFVQEWFRLNAHKNEEAFEQEHTAINKALLAFEELGFSGGILLVDGQIVALTLGEEVNSLVFVTHFEKALTSYAGAYAMINKEFSRQNLAKYSYVNREEDLGLEGLRKAKMSYYPYILLEKFRAVMRCECEASVRG